METRERRDKSPRENLLVSEGKELEMQLEVGGEAENRYEVLGFSIGIELTVGNLMVGNLNGGRVGRAVGRRCGS